MGTPGLARGLTTPDEFIGWRKEEKQDARQREKDNVTHTSGMGRRSQNPHTEKDHTCGRVRQGHWDKDRMGAMASSKCCASWSFSLLICCMELRKSIMSIPFVHRRTQRLESRLAGSAGADEMREFTANPPLCLRAGSHEEHLKGRGSLNGSSPQRVPEDTPVLPYKIQYLKDLRGNYIYALWRWYMRLPTED